ADGDEDDENGSPKEDEHQYHKEDERQRIKDVDKSHHNVVGTSTEVARYRTISNTKHQSHRRSQQTDGKRHTNANEDACHQIATEIISTKYEIIARDIQRKLTRQP